MNSELGLQHLPEYWHLLSLEDIAIFTKGKKATLSNQPQPNALPYLDIQAFEKQEIKQYAVADESTLIDDSSLAIVWDGARSGLVFKGKDGALGSTLMKITPVLVTEFYLYYYLQFTKDYIKAHTKGTGIPHVNPQILFNMRVPVPPIEEQTKIVEKIEELFSELDDSLQKIIDIQIKLELYQQALYDDTFKRISIESIKALSEICSISSGATKGRNFTGKETIELPYLSVANVQDGYLELTTVKTMRILSKEKEKYLLSVGDILYTEGGDRDKLGRGTVWNGEIQDCIHQNHILRARPKTENYNSKYISYYSKTKAARDYFFKSGKQTTNLASINNTILSNLMIPIVPIEDQIKIVQTIDSKLSIHEHSVSKIQIIYNQINTTKTSILKKAFNGKLVAQKSNEKEFNNFLSMIADEKQKMLSLLKDAARNKPKKNKIEMKNKDIIEILELSNEPLQAKQVWENSIYRGDIEKFYAALKKISHRIIEDKKGYILLKEK